MYISNKKNKYNGESASVHLVPEVYTKNKLQFISYWCNL